MSRTVGIDLGTSNSIIAIWEGAEAKVITTAEGKQIPSIVAFTKNGERLVGETAKRQATVNGENTVFSVKRFLGRRYEELENIHANDNFSPPIIRGPRGDIRFRIPHAGKEYTPQEITAILLNHLKKEAEASLGEPVDQAVITVPAYFNDSQRQAVTDAGRIAGLRIARIINEPTAAALSYGLHRQAEETILVVDLGGGTFDVSVLKISNGLVEVKASSGDTHLGGADWDTVLSDWMVDSFLRANGVDLSRNRQALQRIREAAETAKIELSAATETEIHLPFIVASDSGSRHLRMRLTRDHFERLTAPLLARLHAPIQQVLADARIDCGDLDAVVLGGGMTRVPSVRDKIVELTGQQPITAVNPDEAVVRGATLQAGVLAGDLQEMRLQDVTPLSLGLETMGGMMTILIPRNTPIPTRRSEVFGITEDDQTEVEIHVLQGERPMAADNNTLGVFRLEGIPPAARGIPQIEVTFEIDENGILHVSARDRASGLCQTVSLTASTGLTDVEVERMMREAEQCASSDKERRELIEARTVGEQLIYHTERTLEHLNGGTPAAGRAAISSQISALRAALEGDDVQRIRQLTATLQQVSMEWCQCTYHPIR